MNKLKIVKLKSSAVIPRYEHYGDSGMDLISIEEVEIKSYESKLIKTGISIELPPNTEAQIRPRSGLAAKHGITVLNAPGTIDSDYRGPVSVILINHSSEEFVVDDGMRIAQIVVAKVEKASFVQAEKLSTTTRGASGFGHTGV